MVYGGEEEENVADLIYVIGHLRGNTYHFCGRKKVSQNDGMEARTYHLLEEGDDLHAVVGEAP